MLKQIALSVAFLSAVTTAQASVHSPPAFQDISQLDEDGNQAYSAVGIDGNSIILVSRMNNGTRATLLRQGARGRWAVSRVLSDVTLPGDQSKTDVAMKNGIAAVRISTQRILIFERVNNDWTQTDALDSPGFAGGLAISGARILLGAAGCLEGADAFIFEKNATTGRWGVTGRIDAGVATCDVADYLDLNNTTAMIHLPGSPVVQVFRRNGSALDWPQRDAFQAPGSLALQANIAVGQGGSFYRPDANGHWTLAGRAIPVNYGAGAGMGGSPVFRDGILLNEDTPAGFRLPPELYAYAPNAAGGFDHFAILGSASPIDYDVSGRTVVVTSAAEPSYVPYTLVYSLPNPLVGADPLAQDFETRDVTGFTQAGNAGFSLVGAGSGFVYRSAAGGDAIAVLNGSNWRGYEYLEADVAPISVASGDPWIGLALRYTDANNYYVASIRASNLLRIERKVDGRFYLMNETALPFRLNEKRQLTFTVEGKTLNAAVTGSEGRVDLWADDTTFGGGSAALLTSRARADFDNVFARQTAQLDLVSKGYDEWDIYGRPWAFSGGAWEEIQFDGLKQRDTTGSASATMGVPVRDQDVGATVRLDSFGSANPVSSFSVLARYVDAGTYYSLSVRSSGQIQIRKTVNGVTTVLKAASFTPGADFRRYDLRVVGHELHAYVDYALVAVANDADIAEGIFGLASYRTATTTLRFHVRQP
jgi:hypothetical protein